MFCENPTGTRRYLTRGDNAFSELTPQAIYAKILPEPRRTLMQIVLVILITLMFVPSFGAQSDPVDASRPALRVFTDRDGLPQNSVEQVTTDNKKYVWIVTRDGGAFYNGHQWRRVDMPDKSVSNWPRTVLATSDGSVWFGTESNGIHVLKDGKWTSYGLKDGLPGIKITKLYEGHSPGVVWAGTTSGLGRYEGGRWQSYTTQNGLPSNLIRSVLETEVDGKRTILVGTSKGLAQIQGQSVSVLFPEYQVNSLKESWLAGERTLWVGTYGGGLHYLTNGKWQSYTTQNGLSSNFIRDAIELMWNGKRTLWVATEGAGLLRLQSGRWVKYETKNGLPSNYVFSFYLYRAGTGSATLWIGTLNGLIRMREGSWDYYDSSVGLPENSVVSLLETPAAIWFGTVSGGLARLQEGKWSYESAKTGLGHNSAFTMMRQDDSVLVGTEGGLMVGKGGAWRTLISSDEVPNKATVSCLLETAEPQGGRTLWIGWFYGGLTRIKNGVRTHYTTATGLPDDRVEGLLETNVDGRQIVWAATDGGLVKFEGEGVEVFNRSHGLPSDEVRSVHFSAGRYLWVGTGGGVSRTDLKAGDGKWYTLTDSTTPPLPNNVVYQIREDSKGRIYLFTNRGVARLSSDEFGDFSIYTYTTEDGLPSNECNFGASMIDSRGRIWVGTIGGAAVIDPNTERADREPKPLYIESALVSTGQEGVFQRLTDGQRLAYNSNSFIFEYVLVSMFREGDTRYRTQLLGYDSRLSNWSADIKKEYTNLDAGDYTFQVWGKDYAGNITGPVSIHFTIKPAPWKTWWAYVAYALMTVAGGYTLARARLRHMRHRAQRLESIVRERTNELVKQRDAIEEMNTRFMESISCAERIQVSILPHQDELSESFSDYFILFRPKDIVSGDFYWLQQIDGLTVIAMADCTGHGVPGAIMSMMGVNLLDQIVVEKRLISPDRILEQLHRDVRKGLRQEFSSEAMDGMDIGICVIDPERKSLTYAGAKRSLYYSDACGTLQEVKGDRYSIGGLQKEKRRVFTNHTLNLTADQTFYMVTDGFADQQDSRSRKFGSRRLKTFLASISNLPLNEQRQRLLIALNEHQGQEPQRDDIAILGFKPKL